MEEYKAVQADMQHKKKKNGLIAAIIILIILAIAAIGGTWYYMNNKAKNAKKAQDEQIQQLQKQIDDLKKEAESKTSASQTKTFTTQYDKLKFSYPTGWTLTDKTKANDAQYVAETGLPGRDTVKIMSGDGFSISLDDGLYGIGGGCDTCKVLATENITILGNKYYLNYIDDGKGKITIIPVSDPSYTVLGGFKSKNLVVKDGTQSAVIISAGYDNVNKTLAQLKADPNVQEYKNFLQSLSY